MFTITAGTKFAFTVDATTNPVSGIATANEDSNAVGWFTATATDGQVWFLNVEHITAAARPGFAMSYPLLQEDGVVMNGHVEYCAVEGHATRHIDGVLQDHCPRCGNSQHYGRPTSALSAWRVADGVPVEVTADVEVEDAEPAANAMLVDGDDVAADPVVVEDGDVVVAGSVTYAGKTATIDVSRRSTSIRGDVLAATGTHAILVDAMMTAAREAAARLERASEVWAKLADVPGGNMALADQLAGILERLRLLPAGQGQAQRTRLVYLDSVTSVGGKAIATYSIRSGAAFDVRVILADDTVESVATSTNVGGRGWEQHAKHESLFHAVRGY